MTTTPEHAVIQAADDHEDAAWTWLEGAFGNVEAGFAPQDRDYSADEMVDAFFAGMEARRLAFSKVASEGALPIALREQACTVSKTESTVTIDCDDPDLANELFEWLSEGVYARPLAEPQRLGQEGEGEALAVSEDAQRHLAIRSPLNRVIFRALRDYRLSNIADEDGYPYPLVDALSSPPPADIGTGEMEMVAIADDIEEAVRALSTPAQAEPVAKYPAAERAFHVVKRTGSDGETFLAADRATLSAYPGRDREDAYNLASSLNRVIEHHAERAVYFAHPPAPPQDREAVVLSDPNAVHVNLVAGRIARPSVEQIIHIYGAEALRAALRAQALADLAEGDADLIGGDDVH